MRGVISSPDQTVKVVSAISIRGTPPKVHKNMTDKPIDWSKIVPEKLDGHFKWKDRTREETEVFRIAWNKCRKQVFKNINTFYHENN